VPITFHPFEAKRKAMALPKPEVTPVIIAIFSIILNFFKIFVQQINQNFYDIQYHCCQAISKNF
jgi:hypothetical protein